MVDSFNRFDGLDVVVVGSGSGALVAALRAADLGLRTVVLEKEHQYGGTSAFSGGFLWIPGHGMDGHEDSRDDALTYLRHSGTAPDDDRLVAYVDGGPAMLDYLATHDVRFAAFTGYPDYFPDAPGASTGRGICPPAFDGKLLGEHFFTLREQPAHFKLFDRYAVEPAEAGQLAGGAAGWQGTLARILWRYWSDIGWRARTRHDRRLTMGNALIGSLRRALIGAGVEVLLDHAVDRLVREDGRIIAVEAMHNGQRRRFAVRHGVIVAAGGYEQSQEMRDRYFEFPTDVRVSASPRNGNTGAVLKAAMAIGAATDLLDEGWWTPSLVLPARTAPNVEVTNTLTFDYSRPHSLCVNGNGVRFVNEGVPYDQFGQAMRADARASGANIPCWIVFDDQYRRKFSFGQFHTSRIFPDRKVPPGWWDNYVYRAETIEALADKIDVSAAALAATIARMNQFASTGVDLDFGRGNSIYDRFAGDLAVGPNPCLGTIEKAPFYAIPVQLGDLGTKGGLRADAAARVLDGDGQPIPGLYAVGNASLSVFGNSYPGPGATVGPSMVFGFIAANDIAARRQSKE